MSLRNLSFLFRPRSVAVIGATDRDNSVGNVTMRNLLNGGFSGPIMPVNPKRQAVAGVLAYPDVASLPVTPDLAVLCVPARQVVEQIRRLGERGTGAAIIFAGGMGSTTDADGRSLQTVMMETAAAYRMRILGPATVGMMVPAIGLNASFAPHNATPGRIAFVSQSGTLCTAVLDWAKPKGIGFSHFISLGDCANVDFGDVLDYLGSDPSTRAILLYIESIHQRRNFMSAARAAARNKPIIAIKAGRVAESARAAQTHTGSLAGSDAVYHAALRRSGMLRVYELEEMFTAVETLSRTRPPRGTRLAIVSNGGGLGVMAVDELIEVGGKLAELSAETKSKLSAALPAAWSKDNPVDIMVDANGERYAKALEVLFKAPEVDSVLVLHSPSALVSSIDVAEHIIRSVKANKANALTCMVGQEKVGPARRLLRESGIAAYETPGAAVHAFMHLLRYRRNQDMLMETPSSALTDFTPATEEVRRVVAQVLASGRTVMSEPEAKGILEAYGIPVIETQIARTPAEASRIAARMDCPVALKILSSDVTHKSDVGGVMLNLAGPFEVEKAGNLMLEKVAAKFPEAQIEGFTVQRMARRPGAQEIIIGVSTDPIFGPVLMFGQGGTAVEVIHDFAIGLPPLNTSLARDLIERTRIAKLLHGYRDFPAADLDAIALSLIKVSQLIIDIPQIVELDINPLFADASGVIAVDARIKLDPNSTGNERLAIRPYPKDLEEVVTLKNGQTVMLRPIRPEDEPNHHLFVSKLTPEDIRFRFFGLVGELPHTEMARLTQIDYDREMAFIAVPIEEGLNETWGVVRTMADPDNEDAEFAVVVRSDIKDTGLGRVLMQKIINYGRARGTGKIVGQVLHDNIRMLKFIETLGFKRIRLVDGEIVEVALDLRNPA